MQWRDALSAGAIVGERYRILKPLASGGFGAVYEAEQLTTERRVAVKVLFRRSDDGSIDRLLGEARVASRLTSEHVVQVVDAGIDLDTSAVYVAMELLAGITLGDLVERNGPLAGADSAEFLRQIASGLDKAHSHVDRNGTRAPIVHRDLKPANVFVTRRDDGTALLKILDFGTAKVSSAAITSSRIVRGTPQYMAPEQVSGESATPGADIWAFGLLGFFLLTGRSYWLAVAREAPTEALFAEMLALPLARASVRARELGVTADLARLDDWFARTVNRQPSERFTSAGQAAREFARALGVAVAPVRVPELGGPALPTAPVSTTAPVAAPAFRAALPPANPIRLPPTDEHSALARSSAETRGRSSRGVLWVFAALLAGAAGLFVWLGESLLPTEAKRSDESASSASPVSANPAAPERSATLSPIQSREAALAPSSAVELGDAVAPAVSASASGRVVGPARKRIVKESKTPAPPAAPSAGKPKPTVYEIR